MDVKFMHNLTDALKVAGCSIGEDLIPVLYNSLIQLQSENHFESIYFWGRIVTLSNDYYIAYGYQKDPIKDRIFFYSQTILEWDLIPTDLPINETDLVRKIKTKFNGNPRYVEIADKFNKSSGEPGVVRLTPSVLFNDEGAMEGGEEEYSRTKDSSRIKSVHLDEIVSSITIGEETGESESVEDFSANKMIKEEDRLAISVKMIDNECHIAPRGFYYKLPDGNIVKAPYFKGLDYSEIGNENNFLHISSHRWTPGKSKQRLDYNGSIDFLQPIDKDIPKGCWTTRIVSNRYLIKHNLLWPGAVFLQDMNLGIHSFFYNGDGVKNLDLPFMI